MENIEQESANIVSSDSFLQQFKSLSIVNKLFGILLSLLFIAIATNIKRHLFLDLTVFLAIVCLIKAKPDYKSIARTALPLLCLAAFAFFKPCVDSEYQTFALRILGCFTIGLAAELCVGKLWKFCGSLSAFSITFVLGLYYLGYYNPTNYSVIDLDNRMCLTMHHAPGLMSFVAFWSLVYCVSGIGEFYKNNKVLFVISLFACIGSLIVILLSASKACFCGSLFCCFVWLCVYLRKCKKSIVVSVVIVLLICMFSLWHFGKNLTIVQRIHYTIDTIKTGQADLSARTIIWSIVWDAYKKHPIVGTSDSFKDMADGIQRLKKVCNKDYSNRVFPEDSPHNIILSMLHYYGIIGLICYLWLFVINFKLAIKNKSFLLIFILLFEIPVGLFDYYWMTTHGIFYCFFAMGTCHALIDTDSKNQRIE